MKYKLVQHVGNLYTSAIMSGELQTIYTPHERIYAPQIAQQYKYGLCVFSKKSLAKKFFKEFDSITQKRIELWSCLTSKNSFDLPPKRIHLTFNDLEYEYHSFYNSQGFWDKSSCQFMFDWPRGTEMVEWVELQERIV